jgi:hypothetical protein
MKEWTVVLKTPVGFTLELVKADYAAWDEENDRLEFMNVKPGTDLLHAFSKIQAEGRPLTEEEAMRLMVKLLTFLERMKVAGFAKDSVVGYFAGRSGNLKVNVELK